MIHNMSISKYLKPSKLKMIFIFGLMLLTQLSAQTIPAGMPVFDEAIRRAQLQGKIDNGISLMQRPVYPSNSLRVKNVYHFDNGYFANDSTAPSSSIEFLKGYGNIQLLPVTTQLVYNSTNTYGWGDGPIIPARGFQQMVAAGFYAEGGPLTIQFRPEIVWAQNKDFERFPQSYSNQIWSDRYFFWSRSDDPEKFGTGSYTMANLGQSSIRLNAGAFSIGASNENLWWGPGQFNALIFSNNAPGFKHLTLNTRKPIKTFIGNFEMQLLSGRLEGSGLPAEPSLRQSSSRRDDWRYLNAINLTYSPKWLPGLFVGLSRTFQQYSEDMEPGLRGLFPIFDPLQKERLIVDGSSAEIDGKGRDQQISVFMRWIFQEAHAEIYFEFGRRDHALNWRDFIMSPEHARAYLFGLNKLFALSKPDNFLQLRAEATQTQQSVNIIARYFGVGSGQSWGQHTPVRHGFTQHGQQLGIGVGPGSNVQTMELSWIRGFDKIGFMLERLEHQMDFYNRAFQRNTNRRPWVDLSFGLLANWQHNKLLINSRVQFIRSLNYQWQIEETFDGSNQYRGVDRSNLYTSLGLIYLF
jgi:hypothetical protein